MDYMDFKEEQQNKINNFLKDLQTVYEKHQMHVSVQEDNSRCAGFEAFADEVSYTDEISESIEHLREEFMRWSK